MKIVTEEELQSWEKESKRSGVRVYPSDAIPRLLHHVRVQQRALEMAARNAASVDIWLHMAQAELEKGAAK